MKIFVQKIALAFYEPRNFYNFNCYFLYVLLLSIGIHVNLCVHNKHDTCAQLNFTCKFNISHAGRLVRDK
uniref:Uncharacterized protein n=1 Tax=Rhizophora mucronata TaxID=61149 RepID=A0A2P2QBI2_RHIMU